MTQEEKEQVQREVVSLVVRGLAWMKRASESGRGDAETFQTIVDEGIELAREVANLENARMLPKDLFAQPPGDMTQ